MIISALTGSFIGLDRLITQKGYQNPYYAIHSLHNAAIVAYTLPDVVGTFKYIMQPAIFETYSNNLPAIYLCYSLHFYHIISYLSKLRFDDWLHHILMIFIALPIGCSLETRTLVGYSLFFTTGLPGGIDYACLFAVRNGWMSRIMEKKINEKLNVWIRSPGCISHACFCLAYLLYNGEATPWYAFIPPIITYWNGQYFMRQVVADLALQDKKV